jgi:hypothetical protein
MDAQNAAMPPRLIETSVTSHMKYILNKCHDTRVRIYLNSLNIVVFLLFCLIFGAALYYCYRKKLSPDQEAEKMIKDQEYILSKIRFYKEHQKHITDSAKITQLPNTLDPRPFPEY